MFDLVSGKAAHIPQTPLVPMIVSVVAQVTIVGLVLLIPMLYFTNQLPMPSTMMAFVAPAPPPPPPPPPAPAPTKTEPQRPVPTTGAAAPIEAPPRVEPERAAIGGEEGIPGGMAGGIPSGIVGGVVGGFEVPPPPPPPAPAPRLPVRTGGEIQAPALVRRVDPIYPVLAVRAHVEGVVILEAIVNEQGKVESIKVLRSIGVLDRAAIEAVRQWEYEPLMLNGIRTPFILTVTLSFTLAQS